MSAKNAENNEKLYLAFDAALKLALMENARLEMESLPTEAELQKKFPDTTEWDKRILPPALKLLKPKRRPAKVAKRIAIAIMLLICLFAATLITSGDVRTAVFTTFIEWRNEIGIRFQIVGTPLTRLPEGYREHYTAEGFEFAVDESRDSEDGFYHVYRKAKGRGIFITVDIIQNASETWIGSKNITYNEITFNGVTAYLGQLPAGGDDAGYYIIWAKDGIKHQIEAYTTLSELFKIVESIY